MKNLKILVASLSTTVLLAACGTPSAPGTTPVASQQSPAQIAAQICPIAQAIVTDLSSPLAPLTLGEKTAVAAAGPAITTACSLGANIDLSNYQNLMAAVPQLIAAVENSANLSDQAKSNLFLLQVIVNAAAAGQAAQIGGTAVPAAPTAAK